MADEELLTKAASEGDVETVTRLLAPRPRWLGSPKGADVNRKNREGETSLICAASNGHKALVELLLAKGADVEAKDRRHGDTALMGAARNGHKEIVASLLGRGADVNVKDNRGRTALTLAVEEGHTQVASLLAKAADETRTYHKAEMKKRQYRKTHTGTLSTGSAFQRRTNCLS